MEKKNKMLYELDNGDIIKLEDIRKISPIYDDIQLPDSKFYTTFNVELKDGITSVQIFESSIKAREERNKLKQIWNKER